MALKVALWLSGLAVVAAVFETWRTNRILAARGGKGYPIVNTTGIRG